RKFWDCSWRWDCSDLSMAVKGRPGIRLDLSQGDGVRVNARIYGSLVLETNLPWPFNEIIRAFSGIIWEVVKAIINSVLPHITVEIVPPRVSLPDQKTGLSLSGFTPFEMLRDAHVPIEFRREKVVFLGIAVGVTATES